MVKWHIALGVIIVDKLSMSLDVTHIEKNSSTRFNVLYAVSGTWRQRLDGVIWEAHGDG